MDGVWVYFGQEHNLYGIFSGDGGNNDKAKSYTRFTDKGWLKHQTDGSKGVSGAKRTSIIFQIDPVTGADIVETGSYFTSRLTNGNTNSLSVKEVLLNCRNFHSFKELFISILF